MPRDAFVAIVTCFNEDETINYAATRSQVRRQVEAGNNIMCAGTNGDFSALTFDEKVRLTHEVVSEVDGRAKVIVNAGMPSTFVTLKLAREFDRIGVDGIAVITPFFVACTQESLVRHFSVVADSVTTPVYLYDIPARTQNHIEADTARKLATHGNIAGIKDSGGTQETLEAYLQIAKEVDGFDVYSGPDHLVYWALQNGAAGCISGLGNAIPSVLANILKAFNEGNTAEAQKHQDTFAAFRSELYALGFAPAMVKRALYLQDKTVGVSRQPALLSSDEQDAKIIQILRRHGL
ncbi:MULTISPECIES: dihydrodipicolinate synthase family protein [unclassified Rhizobium]|uniref:dihydrodipicolinate synthase family protein n=1 Tax=unclassified Rhizobium TaxID=2613769 RepID=UPI000BC9FE92|nr:MULTISPECIES: dihydrodipicolinate synthase family protein [unclassified Rhizobium]MDH7809503.1 4-hydroxy-tetrahydrodipicolinate synthase [Rhizobium sp. AN67]SOD50419.1 4-hydroxy-tetrahydrodipicolinate synthase [Rhizobium sp. AN6A]